MRITAAQRGSSSGFVLLQPTDPRSVIVDYPGGMAVPLGDPLDSANKVTSLPRTQLLLKYTSRPKLQRALS